MEESHLTSEVANREHPLIPVDLDQPGLEQRLQSARMLVDRLERLSADSYYAHQASGLRGSLLRYLEQAESSQQGKGFDPAFSAGSADPLDRLQERAFEILVRAAQEFTRRQMLSNERE